MTFAVARTFIDAPAFGFGFRAIGVGNTIGTLTYFWNSGEVGNCQTDVGVRTAVYGRVQRDPAGFVRCELWDVNGVRFYNNTYTFSGTEPYAVPGVYVGTADVAAGNVAFFRVHNTLVPLNSRPPVTYDPTDRVFEWKFDNSLVDSSGNGYTAGIEAGSANYSATPDQNAVAVLKINSKSWSSWTSVRAGYPATINACDSYSQADDSNTATIFLQQLSGPSTVNFVDRTDCDTQASGFIFGPYRLQAVATATNGATGITTLDFGAIATDSNGIVINGNAAADVLYGPMIGFGRNGWEYMDDAALRALTQRGVAAYESRYAKDWLIYKTGTVAFKANPFFANATTLSGDITSTATSLVVASTVNLTLSSFPTVIQFGYNGERVLICGATGTTLDVCPDGRGWTMDYSEPARITATQAQAHASGAGIMQPIARWDTTGVSTQFLTDYCSGRQGMFTGTGSYTTGTVSITAGSTTLVGTGTNWNSTGNTGTAYAGMAVRFSALISGVPFEFITAISTVNSTTNLTLARAFPVSATDVTNATYQIFNANAKFTPRWQRPDGTNGHIRYDYPACVSQTQLIFGGGAEAWTGDQTGQLHSMSLQSWMTQAGNGTPNFYDEGAAHYAMYFRSGSQAALDAARWLEDAWDTSPEFDQGWGLGIAIPRNVGALGVVASWQLDGRNKLYTMNRLAKNAQAELTRLGTVNCKQGDLRENAYQFMWLALAAKYETDSVDKASFIASLATLLTREENCQAADGYYPSYNYANFYTPAVTLTNGSTAGTGVDIPAGLCSSVAMGSGTIDNGTATLNGSGIPVGNIISVSGLRAGVPFSWQGMYTGSGSSVTLSGLWAGTSGTVTWIVHSVSALNTQDHTMFANTVDDSQFNVTYPCYWNSSTSITLGKPWQGPNGSYANYRGNLVGAGMQPFMGGIKTLEYYFATQATSGATQTAYATLATEIANWIKTTGYDSRSKGLYYARGFGMSEPPVDPPGFDPVTFTSSPSFQWTISEAQHGFGVGSVGAARVLVGEAQSALRTIYEASPTAPNLTFGDNLYGGQWGLAALTAPGLPTDDGFVNEYVTDGALSAGKWYGFQFGVGMAHQWPAVRLGGVAPPDTRTVKAGYTAPAGASASSMRCIAPSGAESTILGAAGRFDIPEDWRQGNYLCSITHTVTGGTVTGDLLPLVTQ